MPSALARCVGDVEGFLDQYWSRQPLHRPRSARAGFDDLFSFADVQTLLSGGGLRHPAVKLVKDGKTLPSSAYTKRAKIGSVPLADLLDAGRLFDAVADGATVVFNALHRYWPALTRFCRELELALTHPVQVNAYITPHQAQGLGVHYDTHDVFVLQVAGTKHWQIYGQGMELPLSYQHKRAPEDPGPVLLDVTLEPGDSLYVPRGYLHAARTTHDTSAHLTFGVLAYRWMDVIQTAVGTAAEAVEFRDTLPVGFAEDAAGDDAFARAVAGKLAEFAAWVSAQDPDDLADTIRQKFWRGRPPLLDGQLTQLAALGELTDDSLVVRRPHAVARLKMVEDRVELQLGDRLLRLPSHVEPAVALLLGEGPRKVGELQQWLDHHGRQVLVRRLIREGLLVTLLDD